MFKTLKDQVEQLNTEYIKVTFPLSVKDGVLYFANDVPFKLSRDGFNYMIGTRLMAYQKKGYCDIKYARQLALGIQDPAVYDEMDIESRQRILEPLVKYINRGYTRMIADNEREAAREYYIAAMVNDQLHGLLTAYNPVSHNRVLEMIESENLTAAMTWGRATNKELKAFFSSRSLGEINAEFGLMLRNGETGHVAFSYCAAIDMQDYVYYWPLTSARRHLTKIEEAVNNLDSALKGCAQIAITNVLRNTLTREYRLRSTDDTLQALINKYGNQPIGSLITHIRVQMALPDMKTRCGKLLDAIFAQVKTKLGG